MARTYIPTLIRLLKRICVYITAYRDTLVTFLPPSAIPYLNAITEACEALLEEVDTPIAP